MKLIRPSHQILSEIDSSKILQSIERAGRTCYKSEEKMTDESANKFVEMLIKRGHESVLEHQSLSVLFICDRGVSHEIVRHRLASFSQESTRYCNYSQDKFENQLTFIIPEWCSFEEGEYSREFIQIDAGEAWFNAMILAEYYYKTLLAKGWSPQQARSVLPNSLKTEIVVTANMREWRTIFKQRTSAAAHPQMVELMKPLLEELQSILPSIFKDI